MSEFLLLTLYAAIGSIAGILGGALLFSYKKLAQSLARFAVAFAAGVFLALIFFDLLPESQELIGESTPYIIIGITFLGAFFLERLAFRMHHHDDHRHVKKSSIPLVIFGDTVHNFIDGIAIGAAFAVEPSLGLFVAFSAFLHETPHEIADFGILISAGWSRIKAFRANFFSALATFPGAYLAYILNNESMTGSLLAIAAGIFLYVALTDFVPHMFTKNRKMLPKMLLTALIGATIIYTAGELFHTHGDDDKEKHSEEEFHLEVEGVR